MKSACLIWLDWVLRLKQISQQRGILSIARLHDERLLMLFSVWPSYAPAFTKTDSSLEIYDENGKEPYDLEKRLDEWAWDQVSIDIPGLRKILKIEKASEIRDLVELGRRLRLIYPDGSINQLVLGILLKGGLKHLTEWREEE